ncbi:alpha/beta hydrolase [Catellatospora vulcania]|uniref:alpha/beta hydrolase n=1 Tax=Catellatospora vulcania TaxID=1460450 RepID=UPI0018AF8CF1|nr:alpha/beta hydrolase [Catellatospora vulcania]
MLSWWPAAPIRTTTFPQFESYAADWGAELYDAGDVGHIETASGHGHWPDGERLVAGLG